MVPITRSPTDIPSNIILPILEFLAVETRAYHLREAIIDRRARAVVGRLSLVSIAWAACCRRLLYEGQVIDIKSLKQAEGLRRLVDRQGSQRLIPITALIRGLRIEQLAHEGLWYHLVPLPTIQDLLLSLDIRGPHTAADYAALPPCVLSPSLNTQSPSSPIFLAYRHVRLSHIHFAAIGDVLRPLMDFRTASEFEFVHITWDSSCDELDVTRRYPARSPLDRVSTFRCTDNAHLWMGVTRLDESFPLWQLYRKDQAAVLRIVKDTSLAYSATVSGDTDDGCIIARGGNGFWYGLSSQVPTMDVKLQFNCAHDSKSWTALVSARRITGFIYMDRVSSWADQLSHSLCSPFKMLSELSSLRCLVIALTYWTDLRTLASAHDKEMQNLSRQLVYFRLACAWNDFSPSQTASPEWESVDTSSWRRTGIIWSEQDLFLLPLRDPPLTAADIPPELHINIIEYIATDDFGQSLLTEVHCDLTAATNLSKCSLVCLNWAKRCRQILYGGRHIAIITLNQAKDFRWLAMISPTRLTPIAELIRSVEVSLSVHRTTRSWLHLLYSLKTRKKLLFMELRGSASKQYFEPQYRSVHWGLSKPLSPSITPYREVRLHQIYFRIFSDIIFLIRYLRQADDITFYNVTWETNDRDTMPVDNSIRRRPIKLICAKRCTNNVLLVMETSRLDPSFPLCALSDEDQVATSDFIAASYAALNPVQYARVRTTVDVSLRRNDATVDILFGHIDTAHSDAPEVLSFSYTCAFADTIDDTSSEPSQCITHFSFIDATTADFVKPLRNFLSAVFRQVDSREIVIIATPLLVRLKLLIEGFQAEPDQVVSQQFVNYRFFCRPRRGRPERWAEIDPISMNETGKVCYRDELLSLMRDGT